MNNTGRGRRISPVSAFFKITAECPYRCWHCCGHGRCIGGLDTDVWTRAVDDAVAPGVSIVGFTESEPLRRADLEFLVQRAAARSTAAS